MVQSSMANGNTTELDVGIARYTLWNAEYWILGQSPVVMT